MHVAAVIQHKPSSTAILRSCTGTTRSIRQCQRKSTSMHWMPWTQVRKHHHNIQVVRVHRASTLIATKPYACVLGDAFMLDSDNKALGARLFRTISRVRNIIICVQQLRGIACKARARWQVWAEHKKMHRTKLVEVAWLDIFPGGDLCSTLVNEIRP